PFIVLGVVFKIVLFFVLFGLAARLLAGRSGRGEQGKRRCGPSQDWRSDEARSRWYGRAASPNDEGTSHDDRFEEWHRMAHARQEVDDHTPPVED
ncbi:MAG: hypothetical protein OEQ47_19070, partial [Acidimicrobiia bacterium]|nr:hypothetical protein [Acidimicrobiia bacterium]